MKSDYKASILENEAMNLVRRQQPRNKITDIEYLTMDNKTMFSIKQFRNFSTLVKGFEISGKDFGNFKHFTPDHPKQRTM